MFGWSYSHAMSWEVEYTNEFGDWWGSLSEAEQEALAASVRLLEERGPALGFPHSSGINGSKHSHMRELRTQQGGRPSRTLYAFDPHDQPSCWSAETKRATAAGMTSIFPSPTSFTTNIWSNYERKG